jgi:deoxyribodipyrimidine photo-lyase
MQAPSRCLIRGQIPTFTPPTCFPVADTRPTYFPRCSQSSHALASHWKSRRNSDFTGFRGADLSSSSQFGPEGVRGVRRCRNGWDFETAPSPSCPFVGELLSPANFACSATAKLEGPAGNDIDASSSVFPHPAPESFNDTGTAIVWFRNDLRIGDNAAVALANTARRVVPVYVFDERHYSLEYPSSKGFQRTGPFRAHFILQAVKALRSALRWKLSELVVRVGITEEIIADIAQTITDAGYGPVHVVAQKEVTPDEIELEHDVADLLEELSESSDDSGLVNLHFVWNSTLFHVDDLPVHPEDKSFPTTFTQFRKLVQDEESWKVRDEIAPLDRFQEFPRDLDLLFEEFPTLREDLHVAGLADPHDYPFPHMLGLIDYEGGEKEGEDRVNEWIWKQNLLCTYCVSMNESGNREFSSKFSAWLSVGCISPRTVYWNCNKYELQNKRNRSTMWFLVQLLRRDYFRWLAARSGQSLFEIGGARRHADDGASTETLLPVPTTLEEEVRFEAWKEGMTGAPYVDSAMRELVHTGYMSMRCRQNAASFLIHDLKYPDWRAGAEYFQSLLIDYDVASNWGNWAHIAGVSVDPHSGQPLNVTKQGMWCDPTGWFIKRWCGELWQLPAPMVHEPHQVDDEVLAMLGVVPVETYPRPIVALPEVEEWEYPKANAVRGAPTLFGYVTPDEEEKENEDQGTSNHLNEDELKFIEELVVVAVSPDDPRYAAAMSPGEIAAREEASKYT